MKRVKTIPQLMFEIRPSRALAGEVATFAVRNIKQGTIIADVNAPEKVVIISQADFNKLDPITRNKIKGFCVMDDNEYVVPADLNNMGTSWYFNHSCQPNVAFDRQGNYVALRDIKKDEELFLDYGWMFTDPKFKMKCVCGALNCRQVITGRDWLNPEFRKNNLGKMWPGMRKESVARRHQK